MAEKKSGYSASSITVLEGLEAVRKRPGMYIGSTGERGLHHLIWEVVDNAVDEAMAGHATRVDVTLQDDGGVRVVDDGRGIPVGMHPVEKKPAVEVVMTVLHAGGKFDSDSYAVSGGLHGVGVSVVNALSAAIDLEISTDGHVWRQHYTRSVPGPLRKGEPTKRTGSSVTFWPDGDIFETLDFNIETIRRRLQEMAFLNKGLDDRRTRRAHLMPSESLDPLGEPQLTDEDGDAALIAVPTGGVEQQVPATRTGSSTTSSSPELDQGARSTSTIIAFEAANGRRRA